jgi:preprotein translocase subunit SecG
MYSFILFLHVIICMVLLTLVLLQRSKASDIGSSFGAGASTTMFGASGATSFLVKLTAVFAILFFGTSLTLGAMSTHVVAKTQTASDIIFAAAQNAKPAAPVLPQGPAPKS